MSGVNKLAEAPGLEERMTAEELVELVRAGEREVFAQLYERYYSRAYRLAYGMTGHRQEAEDLTQEVFIRAYERLGQYNGHASFSTWFYRLTVNRCLNYCRRRRHEETIDDPEQWPMPDATEKMETKVLHRQVRNQIHRALLSLKPKLRLISILRDIEGLSYDEIAERVRCSPGTIASRLNRARQLLARKLAHLKGTL